MNIRVVARAFLVLAVVMTTFLLSNGAGPATAEDKADEPKPKEIVMLDDEFKPKELTIELGDSVKWVNKGKNEHDATPDNKDEAKAAGFQATGDVLPNKESKPVKFTKEGEFKYHCSYHDDMKATIKVKKK